MVWDRASTQRRRAALGRSDRRRCLLSGGRGHADEAVANSSGPSRRASPFRALSLKTAGATTWANHTRLPPSSASGIYKTPPPDAARDISLPPRFLCLPLLRDHRAPRFRPHTTVDDSMASVRAALGRLSAPSLTMHSKLPTSRAHIQAATSPTVAVAVAVPPPDRCPEPSRCSPTRDA